MLTFRPAELTDAEILYAWASDSSVRANSYEKREIIYQEHVNWLQSKLSSGQSWIYIYNNEFKELVGQIRIDLQTNNQAVIGITVSKEQRGKGYAVEMINKACKLHFESYPEIPIIAYIFEKNIPSLKSFLTAGFIIQDKAVVKDVPSFILLKATI